MGTQVLIVDDEPHILASLGRLLSSVRITYISASSGEEALELLRSHKPAVIVSDYRMPGMSGTEFLSRVEAQYPETVRIILSGFSDFETVLKAVHSGVVHKFLAKPWSNEELIQHLHAAFKKASQNAFADNSDQEKRQRRSLHEDGQTSSQTLGSSEQQLTVMLNTLDDGIVTIDSQGVILSINQAIESIFGYRPKELLGQNVSVLMPEPYRSQHDIYLSRYRDESASSILGNRRRLVGLRKSGEVFPIELSVNRMLVGAETQFLGMVRDISRMVKAERENQLLIEALESSQDGFALFGAGDKLIRWNKQFKQLYQASYSSLREGITYEEFFRDCINNGLFPDAHSQPEKWLSDLASSHRQLPMVAEFQLEPGKWIEIHETRSGNGSVIVTHLDISKLKQTQLSLQNAVTEAEHANSARGRFLAMMSHEIRTPLNGVLGLLQLLQETPLNAQQQQYLKTASLSGQSLLTIISDILDFSKIEADKLELQPIACNMHHIFKELEQLFHLRVEEKSIRLICDVGSDVPEWVSVDGQRLRQVLLNLLSNAIKFTDYGSVALYATVENANWLRFTVIDTGVGIPVQEQDKVFTEFSSIHQTKTDRVYEGTGLGLAISKRLVRLMGGNMSFKSQAKVGSEFWFELPLVRVLAPDMSDSPVTASHHLEGQVLLVDDSATNRLVAKTMLESKGLTVICAQDGYEAIQLYQDRHYDLILMDISMPGIDGLETTKRLQQLDKWAETPIIALTAYAMPEDRERFLSMGMTDYIEKPIDKHNLIHVISRCLVSYPPSSTIERKEPLAPTPEPLFVPERLEQLVHDTSEEALPQLSGIFIGDLTERLKELQNPELDEASIARHFHSIGSSSALYGLMSLHNSSRALEKQCQTGEYVSDCLADYIALAQSSLCALKKHLDQRLPQP